VACYSYWSGIPMAGGELYQRPGRAAAAFPTNDGLTMVLAMAPIAELEALRRDVEGHYLATLDRCGDLGDRVRQGERAERIRVTPDLPNAVRTPHGPGWALVGDAGLVMDPITAQGISNALRDADHLAEAVKAAASSGRPLDAGLADCWRRRDSATLPMYDFTVALASLHPPQPEDRLMLASLTGRQAEIDRFLGVFAGVEPIRAYRSPRNLFRLLGARGLARAAAARVARVPAAARMSLVLGRSDRRCQNGRPASNVDRDGGAWQRRVLAPGAPDDAG
jgi:hypothetical protein